MSEHRYNKCQSCAMPIKKATNRATELDQSLSNKYCKFCYKDGMFIEPNITLIQMQEKCAKALKEEHPFISMLFGKTYVKSISKLERWNTKNN